MRPGDAVATFQRHVRGTAFGLSCSASDEGLILRVLAVLNAEIDCVELGYETRARLYFYLGFQRYVMFRWLSLLSAHEPDVTRERGGSISAILQLLTSPLILEHEAIDEQLYRDMIMRLASEIFALLQVS